MSSSDFKVPVELEPSFLSKISINKKGKHLHKVLHDLEPEPSKLSSSSNLVKWLESRIHLDHQDTDTGNQELLSKDYALILSSSSSTKWILEILLPSAAEPLKASTDYTIVKTALDCLVRKWNSSQAKVDELSGLIDELVSEKDHSQVEGEESREDKLASGLISILQRLSLNNSTALLTSLAKFKAEENDIRTQVIDQILKRSLNQSGLHLPKQTFPRLLLASSPSFLDELLNEKDYAPKLMGLDSKWWKLLAQKHFKTISHFILDLFNVNSITEVSPYEHDVEFSTMIRDQVIPVLVQESSLRDTSVDESSVRLTRGQDFLLNLLESSSEGESQVQASSVQRLGSILEQEGIISRERQEGGQIEKALFQPAFLNVKVGDRISSARSRIEKILSLASIALSRKIMCRTGGSLKGMSKEGMVKTRIHLFGSILKAMEAASEGLDTYQLSISINNPQSPASIFVRSISRFWASASVEKLGLEKEVTSILQRLSKFLPQEAYSFSPKKESNQSKSFISNLLQVMPISKRWEFVVVLNQPHLISPSDSKSTDSQKLSSKLAHGAGTEFPLFILPLLHLHREVARQLLSEARDTLGKGSTLISENNHPSPYRFLIHAGMSYVPFDADQATEAYESRRSIKVSTPSTERMTLIQEQMLHSYWEGLEIKSLVLKGSSTEEEIDSIANPTRSRIEATLKLRSRSPDVRSHHLRIAFSFLKLLDYGKVWEEFWPKLLEKSLRDPNVGRMPSPVEIFSGEKGWNQIYSRDGPSGRLPLIERAAASGDACLEAELEYLWKRRKEPDFNAQSEIRYFPESLESLFRHRSDLIAELCSATPIQEQEILATSLVSLLLQPLLDLRLKFMKGHRPEGQSSGLFPYLFPFGELGVLRSTASTFEKFLDSAASEVKEALREIEPQHLDLKSNSLLPSHERSSTIKDRSPKLKESGIQGMSLSDFSPELATRVNSILFDRDLFGERGDLDSDKIAEFEQAWRLYLSWSRDEEERSKKLATLIDRWGVEEDSSARFLRILNSPDVASMIVRSSHKSPLFERFFGHDQSTGGLHFDITTRWNGPLSTKTDEDGSNRSHETEKAPIPFVVLLRLLSKACSTKENLRCLSRSHHSGFVKLLRARSSHKSPSVESAVRTVTKESRSQLLDSEVREEVRDEMGKLQETIPHFTSTGSWIRSIKLGIEMGILRSSEVLKSTQVLQKAEQLQIESFPPPNGRDHEQSSLLSSLQLEYLLPLGRLLTRTERPILALEIGKKVLVDTELSSWHRRLPFLLSLGSRLSSEDQTIWKKGIQDQVFELGRRQNGRTPQEQNAAPLLKISTIKALVEYLDALFTKGIISDSELSNSVLDVAREFVQQDVRFSCLESLLAALLQSPSNAQIGDAIAAMCGDEVKAEQLKIEVTMNSKKAFRRQVLRFHSNLDGNVLRQNPDLALQLMEQSLIPCLLQAKEEDQTKIKTVLGESDVDSKALESSINAVTDRSTLLQRESLGAIHRFLPYLLTSSLSKSLKESLKQVLVIDEVFEAYETIRLSLSSSSEDGKARVQSLSTALALSPSNIDGRSLRKDLISHLCQSIVALAQDRRTDAIESVAQLLSSLTASLLIKEISESPRWKETRINERPRAFSSLFILLEELGKHQVSGGSEGAEIWLLHFRPILKRIRTQMIAHLSKCSPSDRAALLALISFSSYQLLPLSILLPPPTEALPMEKRVGKIGSEVLDMLSETLNNFKGLGGALRIIADQSFKLHRCPLNNSEHIVLVCEELLKSVTTKKSEDLTFLVHSIVKSWTRNVGSDESRKKFRDGLLEKGRMNENVAISLIWQAGVTELNPFEDWGIE